MPDDGRAAEVSPHQALLRMITGSWVAQAIYVAAKLQIADRLRDGPQASTALAATTGAHPRALYRVLRALASVGIFSEDEQGRFSLTPLAEPLRSDVPGSVRAFSIFTCCRYTEPSLRGVSGRGNRKPRSALPRTGFPRLVTIGIGL